MNMDTIELKKIVAMWLEANGYDGLANEEAECGCEFSDFMPCEEPNILECVAGHNVGGQSMFPGKKVK